ncbi:MAG: type II secretory pathway pseudopilin PulG, partial [Rhodothermales bacterium]
MVVIAIIAILAALLLPSLSQARYKAKQASCFSQIKQQSLYQFIYAGDSDGKFPEHKSDSSPDYHRRSSRASSIVNVMKESYITDAAIFICPITESVESQPHGEYWCNDWDTGSYGGWDSDAGNVYQAY